MEEERGMEKKPQRIAMRGERGGSATMHQPLVSKSKDSCL